MINAVNASVVQNKKPHKPPNPNIMEVLYLNHNCKINGKMFTAEITVKVYKSQKFYKYYHYYLNDYILK